MSKMTFAKSSNSQFFSETIENTNKGVWKIIISDDEEQVHEITKLALTHFSFDNLMLYKKVEKGQREIVNLLGTSIETRSKETGNHIKRVAAFSALLVKHVGMNDEEIEILKLASPLHDLGKIGIPDAILNKPGKLDKNE
jgi:HD-GYP domain-containing protein (c-di-GMP phosphodiesterase class II)